MARSKRRRTNSPKPERRRKLKSWKSDSVDPQRMVMREVTIREGTKDPKSKTVDVVIATENPVQRFDWDRNEVYDEILLMSGMELRDPDHPQLPIVDSHDRSTVRNVLGSVRGIGTGNGEAGGKAMPARDQASQDAFDKLLDGHLRDFSITATPIESIRINGDQTEEVEGVTYSGPAEVITRWTPTDASLVAAGADPTSTVRQLLRSYQIPFGGIERMKTETRDALVAQGMPDSIDDANEAIEWMLEHQEDEDDTSTDDSSTDEDDDDTSREEDDDPGDDDTSREDEDPSDDDETTERAQGTSADEVRRIIRQDAARRKEIRAIVKKAGLQRSFADQLCDNGTSLNEARKVVLKRMSNKPVGGGGYDRIEVTASRDDKYHAAMRDGLILRAMNAIPPEPGKTRIDPFGGRKPARGHDDFIYFDLFRMAEDILRRGGVRTQRMTKRDIAMAALGHPGTLNRLYHTGQLQRAGEAWHTTGMLPNLMLDAANKTLLAGYEEADYTWRIWARQAPSVPDFKNINRIRYSDSPDLEVVPENHDYPEGKTTDKKESYSVEKFGRLFSVTWETIVGDDLDAISRVPQMHGASARRTQNKHVYAILTDNDPLSDNIALFHASHGNLAGSGGAISATTLDAAYAAMRIQTGLDGTTKIRVIPRFLIVPAAIEATAEVMVTSMADPDAGGSNPGNSNKANLYGPQGRRRLTVVGEPELDGNSTTAWYLAAAFGQVDTVELSFLQGEETPVLENEWNFKKDVMDHKIRQTFGTKGIDHVGLYKNDGA